MVVIFKSRIAVQARMYPGQVMDTISHLAVAGIDRGFAGIDRGAGRRIAIGVDDGVDPRLVGSKRYRLALLG